MLMKGDMARYLWKYLGKFFCQYIQKWQLLLLNKSEFIVSKTDSFYPENLRYPISYPHLK